MTNSPSSPKENLQVGVDVGGTFTDVCVLDLDSGKIRIAKIPTTPNPIDGVLEGLNAAGVVLEDVALFAHGTTVATNALLTRRYPNAAMVTTAGFRDIIEIRRGTRNELWDTYKDVAPPYIRRRDRLVVTERVNAAGLVVESLDEEEARRVAHTLRRREVSAVAVCFINSFTNPVNEQRMKEILEEELDGVFICTSSEVLPEIFEHERFSTTVANAILAPVVGDYIEELGETLTDRGYGGELLVLHCGGGVMTPRAAGKLPARLASSGIAAGAIAARHIAETCGHPRAIGLDMGGTSADISLVYDGALRMTREWAVEYGYPILFPSIEVLTIGAGGGSLAWVDEGGSLRNGPQSAGSSPGPACYGNGNEMPTNTDANLITGRLGERLIGGAMMLDRALAAQAISSKIAEPLQMSLEESSDAILRVATANMADAVRVISIGRGYDPRDFALVAFGGAGALHGAAVARELAIPHVVIPPHPGITSALGCLLVDVRHDLTRMFLGRADRVDPAELMGEFSQLEAEARQLLEADGIPEGDQQLRRTIDMRYRGQWRSITVPLDEGMSLGKAVQIFHAEHEREHNYRREESPVEVYQLHVTALGLTSKAELPRHSTNGAGIPDPIARRLVLFEEGEWAPDTPVYARTDLRPGAVVPGPAIIEQLDTTTVIPPGVDAEIDDWLNMRLEIKEH